MDFATFKNSLAKFLPENAVHSASALLYDKPIQLSITRNRSSKLGDYRPPHLNNGHRISVNGTLNKYAFLLTLIHEYAHFLVQERYGNKVKPHGQEWKRAFQEEMLPFLNESIFPKDLLKELARHMANPSASSQTDVALRKAMMRFDENTLNILEDLEDGSIFRLKNSRIFQRGKKLRTRYQCKELTTGRMYRVHALAEVELIKA